MPPLPDELPTLSNGAGTTHVLVPTSQVVQWSAAQAYALLSDVTGSSLGFVDPDRDARALDEVIGVVEHDGAVGDVRVSFARHSITQAPKFSNPSGAIPRS